MSKVDEAILEIDVALADMAPKHEGLRDYKLLNLKEDAAGEVGRAIAQYDRRKAALEAAKGACTALVADGYPALAIPEVSVSALADLQENQTTIAAALAQFRADPAARLGFTEGAAEMKA